jgi:serine/threonine protein kinase
MNGDSSPKRILHIEEGQDYLLEPGDELPFKLLRNLGQGGCANVEEVVDQHTGRVFARKVFGIGGSPAERRRIFDNEIRTIRRLAPHHHITRVFATYVGRHQIGILLTPVADRGSLDMFLQDAHDGALTQSELNTLYYSFGCLAGGLWFMHAQKVRHKDIKPHNILVHKGSFIYTDFGSFLDYSAATRSVTTGRPDSITRKYAAPELYDWSPRSSKTDIFSLGCVFFEILGAILLARTEPSMTPYRDHIREIHGLLRMARNWTTYDDWIPVVIDITRLMLNVESEARPSAETITGTLSACLPSAFCEKCRTTLCNNSLVVYTPAVYLPQTPATLPVPSIMPSPVAQTPDVQATLAIPRVVVSPIPEDQTSNVLDVSHSRLRAKITCHECGEISPNRGCHKYGFEISASSYLLTRNRRHMLKHTKPFKCDVPGCPRIEGFVTSNDLERHQRSIHGKGRLEHTYKCAVETCRNREKIWPRYDNFVQHIERMHKGENLSDLVERYVVLSCIIE